MLGIKRPECNRILQRSEIRPFFATSICNVFYCVGGPRRMAGLVSYDCYESAPPAPRAARRRCNCRSPERRALAARHSRTCTCSPCRGCRCCGDALEGPHAYGTGHAKLPTKEALTLHAARRTHHACTCAYALNAHAECSFALSVTAPARMTCYTSTIRMRNGQHAHGRLGAGALVAGSMLRGVRSTIRSASAYNEYMQACVATIVNNTSMIP